MLQYNYQQMDNTVNQFISFPKSGRTWIRYCLLQYGLTDNEIKFHHDGFEYSSKKDPALNFDIIERVNKYNNLPVVFMKRNLLDTYLSFYYHIVFRFQDVFHLDLNLAQLSAHPYFGYQNLLSFHQMQSNVLKQLNNKIIVDYQECQNDMGSTITKILEFYKVDINTEKLKESIAKSSFEEMRKVEEEQNFAQDWLLPRNNAYKTRKGVVGSFYNESDAITRHYFNDTLLNHSIVDNYPFICSFSGSLLITTQLCKEIDFIFKRYKKKIKVLDKETMSKEYPYLHFENQSMEQQTIILEDITKEWLDKRYNVLLNFIHNEKELYKLNDVNQQQYLSVDIKSNNIEYNKNSDLHDINVDSILNLEQSVTKVLSEIYYNLLYK